MNQPNKYSLLSPLNKCVTILESNKGCKFFFGSEILGFLWRTRIFTRQYFIGFIGMFFFVKFSFLSCEVWFADSTRLQRWKECTDGGFQMMRSGDNKGCERLDSVLWSMICLLQIQSVLIDEWYGLLMFKWLIKIWKQSLSKSKARGRSVSYGRSFSATLNYSSTDANVWYQVFLILSFESSINVLDLIVIQVNWSLTLGMFASHHR